MTNISMHFGGLIAPEPEVEAHATVGCDGEEFAVISIDGWSLQLFFRDKAGAFRFANAITRAVANIERSSQPDGPVADSDEGYKITAAEAEQE